MLIYLYELPSNDCKLYLDIIITNANYNKIQAIPYRADFTNFYFRPEDRERIKMAIWYLLLKEKGAYTGKSQTKTNYQVSKNQSSKLFTYKAHNTSDLYGFFKGKRIVDNYEKLIVTGIPKSVIDNFIRISPVAWEHLPFTGRYNFTTDNSIMDLEKLGKTLT